MHSNIGSRMAVLLLAASLVPACGGGGNGGDDGVGGVPPTKTLTGVNVSGNNSVAVGQATQFQASASFSDGSTESVTTQASWSSENTNIATVTSSGVATGVLAGNTQIRAAHQNMSGSAPLQVTAAAPPPPTAPVASFTVSGPGGNNVCRLIKDSGGDFDCTLDGSASTGGSGGAVVQWIWRWDVGTNSGGPVTRTVPTFQLTNQCGFFQDTVKETSPDITQMIVKLVVRNAAGVESQELRNTQVILRPNDECNIGF